EFPKPVHAIEPTLKGQLRHPCRVTSCRADFPRVTGLRRQARIVHRLPHRKVIQALPFSTAQPQKFVHGVVIKTPDSCPARPGGLSLEIQHLTDHSALPEEPSVEPLTPIADRRFEARNHAETEEAVAGDL